ncbi:MAG TPA: indole-3-glycerol phosphate synthase TrpC [Desulfomonilaceae bacterium]|nr:indole-3-glycerol phosphate synthase TrpC [Desulfomonilaceae bacterium]
MATILEKIVYSKRNRVAHEKDIKSMETLEQEALARKEPLDFLAAFGGPGIHIIAEVKKASPSKGMLNESMNPAALVRLYQEGGACAVSVVTEEDFFCGSLSVLETVRAEVSLPVLRKDFIVDPYQIVEARASGADSFLLIAALLDATELEAFAATGRMWGMEPLVEVHNLSELEKALIAGARAIGINNRDLKTFQVDLQVTLDLMQQIPADRIVISESGIRNREDILLLADAGANGFLIGESLVTAEHAEKKLREFIHGL